MKEDKKKERKKHWTVVSKGHFTKLLTNQEP